MKTTKRKLAVQWQAANEKEELARVAFAQRDVMVKELASQAELVELMGRSARHAEMMIDLVNSQFHIRFGSTSGKAELVAMGAETEKDARELWDNKELVLTLDYLAAFDEAARREKKEKSGQKSAFELFLATQPIEKQKAFAALDDATKQAKEEAFNAHMAAMSI